MTEIKTKHEEQLGLFLAESNKLKKEMIDYLYNNRNDLVLVSVGEYTINYTIAGENIFVWIANGEGCCRFYSHQGFLGLNIDLDDYYTEDMKKDLWNMTREAIHQQGERRRIEKTQMRNDLFFKPMEVNEDESIVWSIDWEKVDNYVDKLMEAVYKPIKTD